MNLSNVWRCLANVNKLYLLNISMHLLKYSFTELQHGWRLLVLYTPIGENFV